MTKTATNNAAETLIQATRALDAQLTGFGLYACCEEVVGSHNGQTYGMTEWQMGIRRYLTEAGYTAKNQGQAKLDDYRGIRFTRVQYKSPDAKICDLRIIRVSKIKVRAYGSSYQMDRSVHLEDRWDEKAMSRLFRKIQEPHHCHYSPCFHREPDLKLVLLLGFDSSSRPFHHELAGLEKITRWMDHENEFISEAWGDPYKRNFYNIAACWTFTVQKEKQEKEYDHYNPNW